MTGVFGPGSRSVERTFGLQGMPRSRVARPVAIGALAWSILVIARSALGEANPTREPDPGGIGRVAASLRSPEARDALRDMRLGTGDGDRDLEVAAWLACDGATCRLVPWPASREFRRATWRGAVPAGAIAIVHTHPAPLPWPSHADRRAARATGLPVVVVTTQCLVYVDVTGRVRRL